MSSFPSLAPVARGSLTLPGWDRASLGGEVLPGKAKVTKGGVRLKKDLKKKAGADAARPTFHGLEQQEFELEVLVWTNEQLARLGEVCRQVLPRQGVEPKPIALDHPAVRHLGDVVSVVVTGAGVLVDGELPHSKKLAIQLLHWLPVKASPKGKTTATVTPKRASRNLRSEDAGKRNPPNPAPSTQVGFCGPPISSPG